MPFLPQTLSISKMAQEEEICTRISESVKMAGFLEKKGKMKIMSAWKKYWFVLEERLLLYYRSQIEYINLSPCRGSLNMGLVTTVRPGSSAGPCVIHVITRTQVVQLRAKNRATQEEWMQALLDSMSLPLFNKTLKTPLIADLHGHRYSMDNIPAQNRLRKTESERSEKPQGFEYRKKDISDSFYGGSLDTVVWSKKFRTVRSPSPNIPKGKMLEKIMGYVEEGDAKSASDMVSLIEDDISSSSPRSSEKKFAVEDEGNGEDKETAKTSFICENENNDYSSSIAKGRKSLSDNELNDKIKFRGREESQLDRIKNAMRNARDRAFKTRTDLDRKPSSIKKRRQSFLQKVFKRHYRIENEKETTEDDSDLEDPLYDTIENVQEQKESLMSSTSESSLEVKKGGGESQEEIAESDAVVDVADTTGPSQPANIETQKPVFGSKSILSAQAMSELKTKLKSRESVESQCEMEDTVPDLPPRSKTTRPRSPWHDIPVNNAPINAGEPVNPHGGSVKFHDVAPVVFHEPPKEMVQEETERVEEKAPETGKQNDLAVLLEQLSEITGGSLEGRSTTLTENEESWEKPRLERRFSDPDYDVPRPHKLINLCISEDGEKIAEIHYLQKAEDGSDTSSSFHSIEPDSLESSEKKISKIS